MSTIENKEKNLNKLVEKLGSLTLSYTQSNNETQKIIDQKNHLEREKKIIDDKHQKLISEHDYLKKRLIKLQEEVNQKSKLEERFDQDINELSQETESLVDEIEKWQT